MPLVCDCDDEVPIYSRYYDTPDGCDTQTKALVLGRYGVMVGAAISIYDINMWSHAVGVVNIAKRFLYHAAPLGMMGVTFAVVTNTVLQMRNVDDKLNYFIGGVAASPIATAYIGHPIAIVPTAVLLGIAAVVKKTSVDAGVCLFPRAITHMNTINAWRHDYSLVKDPKDEITKKCDALIQKYRDEIRRKRRGDAAPLEEADECAADDPK